MHSDDGWWTRLVRRLAGRDPEEKFKESRDRHLCCHSVFWTAALFPIGIIIPAFLIFSVAYVPNSLAAAQGCRQSATAKTGISYEFSCDSASLTRVALILAIVHLAVATFCTVVFQRLLGRWARRYLSRKEDWDYEESSSKRV